MTIQLQIVDCRRVAGATGLRIQGRPFDGRHCRAIADRLRGVALLEVVLALAVFFGVAVTILSGLSVCMHAVTQVREEAQAADLGVTVLSQVQMGVLDAADAGPTPFEDPFGDWTWQTTVAAVEATVPGLEMTQIEITVKNMLDGYSFRLYGLLPPPEEATVAQPSDTDGAGGTP